MTFASTNHPAPAEPRNVPDRHSFVDPFPHHVWPQLFPDDLCQQLEAALRGSESWKRTETPGYQYDVLNAAEYAVRSGGVLRAVLDLLSSEESCRSMSALAGVTGCGLRSLFAHVMRAGDSVGVHVDHNDWGDEFRLVIYLSQRGEFSGGELRLHAADQKHTVRKSIAPEPGSAFLFRFASESYHSVTRVGGAGSGRLSLVATYGRS